MGEQSSLWRGLRHMMAGTSDALVSVLFPSGCRLCEMLLTRSSRVPICEECLDWFRHMPQKVCQVCGWLVRGSFADGSKDSNTADQQSEASRGCTVCASRTLGFDWGTELCSL